jgi:hemerythrin-like domain-containing protein
MTDRSLAADASDENVARLAQRCVDRYEVELANHFEVEEQVLFPAALSKLTEELIAEHRQLESMVERLRTTPSAGVLTEFTALLRRHIRREENELFELMQRDVPRETLEALAKKSKGKSSAFVCDRSTASQKVSFRCGTSGARKVRDNYAVGDQLPLVATDRISAFDYILATGIPRKAATHPAFIFVDFSGLTRTHFLTADVDQFLPLRPYRDLLEGRSMLSAANMIEIECVARGHSGSGWRYRQTGTDLRDSTATRTPRIGQTAGADLHPCHQSNYRTRRKHLLRADERARHQQTRHATPGPHAGYLSKSGRLRRDTRADCRRYEIRVRLCRR